MCWRLQQSTVLGTFRIPGAPQSVPRSTTTSLKYGSHPYGARTLHMCLALARTPAASQCSAMPSRGRPAGDQLTLTAGIYLSYISMFETQLFPNIESSEFAELLLLPHEPHCTVTATLERLGYLYHGLQSQQRPRAVDPQRPPPKSHTQPRLVAGSSEITAVAHRAQPRSFGNDRPP